MVLVLAGAGQVQGDFRFGEPANLGSTINSSDDEYDPDISTDGLELYFQFPLAQVATAITIFMLPRAPPPMPRGRNQRISAHLSTVPAWSSGRASPRMALACISTPLAPGAQAKMIFM